MSTPAVRRPGTWVPLTKDEFRARFYARFYDPAFDAVQPELERVFEKAWEGYGVDYRKSPRTQPAGPGFADPSLPVPIEWLQTRAAIDAATRRHADPASPTRILLVNGSTRSQHTCPGEISKTLRLVQHARGVLEALGLEVDQLDVSLLADEPLKVIHPCKACVSTAMPLCHWPCSCYPNHALGQTGDWMAELYPRWVAAHGVFIACPVHWYHAPASLKLMIDRLVCADGGNPDFTSTGGKDPARAKALELAEDGWHYPKHLAGRAFAVVAHGDAAGPENLRRMLVDWLTDIGMIQAGPRAALDTWIGWYRPYATSHDDLDADADLFVQVEQAARSLAAMVAQIRGGTYRAPDAGLHSPREK
jgi:multimeric flavodoxin WrbA